MQKSGALVGVLMILLGIFWEQIAQKVQRGSMALPREMEWGLLFTAEQLALHDGNHIGFPLYLVCAGNVYDVTGGEHFYAPGKEYSHFAGQDATLAFWTGEVLATGNDDTRTLLTTDAINGVMHWYEFYRDHETYKYVGRVVGLFYDAEGQERPELTRLKRIRSLHMVREGLKAADESEQKLCSGSWSGKLQAVNSTCKHWNRLQREQGLPLLFPRYKFKWWAESYVPEPTESTSIQDSPAPSLDEPLVKEEYYCVCISREAESDYLQHHPSHLRHMPDCDIDAEFCMIPRDPVIPAAETTSDGVQNGPP